MNKNKIILSSVGGVALVAAAVLGYLLWSACDEKSEMESELENAKENVQRANSAKVAPTQASIDAIDANRKMLDAWRADALALASAGDRSVDAAVTPEAFKKRMADDARELRKLPGGSGKPLVAEDFGFGFKEYIAEGKMPEKAKLAAMQRQWDEVKLFTRTLAEAGAVELVEVTVVDAQAAAAQPEEPATRRGQRGRQRRGADEEAEQKSKVAEQSYVVKFLARPAALVGALNAFTTCERFVAVDSCSFARADDTLAAVLGGKDKKEAARSSTSRRRRRGPAVDEPKEGEEEAQKKGLVTDPESDMPFTVTLKITTFDFGTAAVAGAAAPAPTAPAEAGKESKEEEE